MKAIIFFAAILGLAVGVQGYGQAVAGNPFELEYRLRDTAAGAQAISLLATIDQNNPFELLVYPDPVKPAAVTAPAVSAPVKRKPVNPVLQLQHIKLAIAVTVLVLLALLMTLLRGFAVKSVAAFFNDNQLFQLYREQEGRGVLPFLLLYLLFFLNAGIFVFFVLRYYQVEPPGGQWQQLGWGIFGVSVIVLVKHLLLGLVAYIFPVGREVSRYHFLIVVFGIVMGLFLAPVNLLLAYGPGKMAELLILGTGGLMALTYLFRAIRGLIIANKFLAFHKFHFLLYICSVEIAPVLIILKLILNQLENQAVNL